MNSFLLLKTINLIIEEERDKLITIKNNNVKNSVFNYFKNIIRSAHIMKTDHF